MHRRSNLFPAFALVAAATSFPAAAQVTRTASVPSDAPTAFGVEAERASAIRRGSVSADGRYVVFSSRATNLSTSDHKQYEDVFRRDMQTGAVELVSRGSGGPGIGDSRDAVISANGRYVAFGSDAENLVPTDMNNRSDVFVRDMVAGTTVLASLADDETLSNDFSYEPSISDDGNRVAFHTGAALVASDSNGVTDLYVRDLATASTLLASTGTNPNITGAQQGVLSGNGLYVAFATFDSLESNDSFGGLDVYRRDLGGSATELVTIGSDGFSSQPSISADGNLVAFDSNASTLVAGDTNMLPDVFVRNMTTSTTTRQSVDAAGTESTGGDALTPALSRNGLYVVFDASATNLVANDTNGSRDVFVKTIGTGAIARVSVDSAGNEFFGESQGPASVADAGEAVFTSDAPFVTPDTSIARDVFRRAGAVTARVSETAAPLPIASDGDSRLPALSADGRYVVFESRARNLEARDCEKFNEVYRRDLTLGTTERVVLGGVLARGKGLSSCEFSSIYTPDVSDDGDLVAYATDSTESFEVHVVQVSTGSVKPLGQFSSDEFLDGEGFKPVVSGNATYTSGFVAFLSTATNFPGDTNDAMDVYVRDLSSFALERASVSSAGVEADDASVGRPAISTDGRYVAFASFATNLVAGDDNANLDVFVRDRQTAQTTRVSLSSAGTQGDGDSETPALSGDGRYVAFASNATNLVDGDTNDQHDVFVHDRATGQTTRVSVATGGGQLSGNSRSPRISADGRFIVFTSTAAFSAGTTDGNGRADVFVHDRLRLATWRASVDATGTESAQGADTSFAGAAISDDGTTIAFESNAGEWIAALAGYQGGNIANIFVADRAATTLMTVTDQPDPSPVGATIDMQFAVGASAGTASGNVTVAATTGESCSASLAVGVCQLTFATPGTRTLDIFYEGSPTHFPARAPFESHQVEPPGDEDGFTGETPLVAPDGDAGDQAGMSVASSDEFVVVGAPNGADGDGAVYVFRRVTDAPVSASAKSVAGLVAAKDLVPVATLTNSGGAFGDKWGSAVAISGDGSTIVVGAPEAGAGGGAFTFSRPGSNWTSDSTPDASLVPSGGVAFGDKFGSAVAIGGNNMVAVGAPGAATGGNPGAGSATVFNGSAPIATVAPAGADADANFGQSLAMSGGNLVIGAPNEGANDNGAVRLYSVTADSVGAPTSLAPAGGAAFGDKWGSSVAIDGTTIVGGSPGATGGNGAGYVFQDTGGGFTQRGMLTGGADAAGSAAGTAVAVAGDYILLGAPLADVGGNANQGRAFVFLQPDGGWADASAIGTLERANGAAGDGYGTAVVLTRRGAIVGIPNSDLGLETDQGEADSFVVDRIFKATFE